MYIYVINLCVDTKTTDIYDQVAINKYPIVVFGDDDYLLRILNSENVRDYVKEHISKQLYENASWYIRKIEESEVNELKYDLPSTTIVEYT